MNGHKHRIGALGACLVLALAACNPQVSNWSGQDAPKQNEVEMVRLNHPIKFQPGSARLAAGEADQFAAFLARARVGYGDRIMLQANGLAPNAGMATERHKEVASTMLRVGLVGLPITAAVSGEGTRDTMTVSVTRYVVTPVACPDWSKPSGVDPSNVVASNFGCANTRNLGLMVADPGDLVTGRTLGPSDGTFAAGAIDRYRSNRITPLEGASNQSTGTGQGQGQGGQQGGTTQ